MSTTFNALDYIKQANEREQASRDGKTPEPKPAAAVEPKPAAAGTADPKRGDTAAAAGDSTHDGEGHRVSRSTRRLLRQLGEAEGRAKVFEELVKAQKPGDKPAAPAEEDPEPQAKDFTDYNKFQAELTKWQARKETAKQLTESQQAEAFRAEIQKMDAKAAEDKKLLPDFDQVAQAAIDDDEAPEFVPDEHPNLMGLLATSDVKAFVLYHLAKYPDEMQRMLDLSKTPGEQIRQFARLEGRVEKLYGKPADDKKDDKKPPETAAERDARKARPSESVAAHGGSAPQDKVSPVLADGKTLNPAWKDQANMREGRRR